MALTKPALGLPQLGPLTGSAWGRLGLVDAVRVSLGLSGVVWGFLGLSGAVWEAGWNCWDVSGVLCAFLGLPGAVWKWLGLPGVAKACLGLQVCRNWLGLSGSFTIKMQSTDSQHTVNIQSTYSQHTVNTQSTQLMEYIKTVELFKKKPNSGRALV